jgi:hypothetical protein
LHFHFGIIDIIVSVNNTTTIDCTSLTMAASKTILDIRGKQLKLETAADVTPFITGVDPTKLTAIHLGGNSIGVEAAKEFGRFLETAEVLQVRTIIPEIHT